MGLMSHVEGELVSNMCAIRRTNFIIYIYIYIYI